MTAIGARTRAGGARMAGADTPKRARPEQSAGRRRRMELPHVAMDRSHVVCWLGLVAVGVEIIAARVAAAMVAAPDAKTEVAAGGG